MKLILYWGGFIIRIITDHLQRNVTNWSINLSFKKRHYLLPEFSVTATFLYRVTLYSNHTLWISAISNYLMLGVGVSSVDYKISLTGSGVNCNQSKADYLSQLSTAAFPSTMNRIFYQGIAYADETSTLVICGGSQVSHIEWKLILFWNL